MRIKNLNGFTLVEIAVVMAIVAIVGLMMLVIFTNTLRGSNKAQVLAAIKQNGQAVLENMDKTIRGADDVICPGNLVNSGPTLVIVKNGTYTRYRFIAPAPGNGLIQQDNPAKQPVGSRVETESEFDSRVCCLAGLCGVNDPMTQIAILTDTNSQSGVSVLSGSFTRNIQPGFKDNITVSFVLGPGVEAPPIVAGKIDPVTFQTTVQLR